MTEVNYLANPWHPQPYTVIKDPGISEEVYTHGYRRGTSVSDESLAGLRELYAQTHKLSNGEGGMFYSVYSQDLQYRKHIHDSITELLAPFLQRHFSGYRVMLSSFVVKTAGPNSEFYLHQDTTGLDEWKYSPISLWIPLQAVDEQNGCLGIIPKSHHFFSPYRSISFPAPFDHIQPTVRQYLQPMPMDAGEVFIFDNRLLHHSYANTSQDTRVAVVCGLFPEDAPMMLCHKPEYRLGGQMELIEQADAFLQEHKNFLIDCQQRPQTGHSLGWKEDPYGPISVETFEALCLAYDVPKLHSADYERQPVSCKLISEPQ